MGKGVPNLLVTMSSDLRALILGTKCFVTSKNKNPQSPSLPFFHLKCISGGEARGEDSGEKNPTCLGGKNQFTKES